MKTKKILCLALSAAVLLTAMVGCGQQEATGSSEKVEEKGQMEGQLVSFSGSTLEVKDAKQSYTFDVSSAEIKSKYMRSGDELMIYFDGEISGTDTSNAKVTSVEDYGNPEDQEEKTVVGTLTKITENTITIKQNDGTSLTFCSNNCQHEFKNGIREGNWVVITYIGEIQGTDTTNVTVLKITDNDENKVKKEQDAMEMKAVDETVYATAGVHVRASYTTDSEVVGSLEKGQSIKRTGVCANGWSRVLYQNADAYVYGDYLSEKAPEKDAPAAKTDGSEPTTPQQGTQPEPVKKPDPETTSNKSKTVSGTVTEVSMNTLSFENSDGEFTVNIMDAEHEYANGIQTGNRVTITYTGDLSDPDSVIVTKVTDADSNKDSSDDSDNNSGSDSDSNSGSDSGSNSGSDSDSSSGSDSDSSSGSDSGSSSGSDSGSSSGSDSDSNSGSDSGSSSGSDSDSDSGSDSDSDSGSSSGSDSDSDSGSDSGATSQAVYTGVIVDGTMNTITIKTDDGATMTFSKDSASDSTDGDETGTRVRITADMDKNDNSQNVLEATSIDPV